MLPQGEIFFLNWERRGMQWLYFSLQLCQCSSHRRARGCVLDRGSWLRKCLWFSTFTCEICQHRLWHTLASSLPLFTLRLLSLQFYINTELTLCTWAVWKNRLLLPSLLFLPTYSGRPPIGIPGSGLSVWNSEVASAGKWSIMRT